MMWLYIGYLEGGVKIRELLKSNKLLCSPPPGLSSGSTTTSQTIPSQEPEINDNDKDDLSEKEIKILKSKLIIDNILEGLLELENKVEPSIESTIESRLEKDNLIQDGPGEMINCHSPAKPSQAKLKPSWAKTL